MSLQNYFRQAVQTDEHFARNILFDKKYHKLGSNRFLLAVFIIFIIIIPAGNYMLKVKSRNTRTRCEICSKSEHISHLVIVFLLFTLSREIPVGCIHFLLWFNFHTPLDIKVKQIKYKFSQYSKTQVIFSGSSFPFGTNPGNLLKILQSIFKVFLSSCSKIVIL